MKTFTPRVKLSRGALRSVPPLIYLIAFGTVGTALVLWTSANPKAPDNRHAIPVSAAEVAQQRVQHAYGITGVPSKQLQLAAMDVAKNPGKKAAMSPKLKSLAAERKQNLATLIDLDPAKAREFMLSDQALTTLRALGLPVETPATITGTLGFKQVSTEDSDSLDVTLTTAEDKTYVLKNEKSLSDIKLGTTLRIRGHILDDKLLVAADETGPVSPSVGAIIAGAEGTTTPTAAITIVAASAATDSVGPITDAVMMANFSGGNGTVDPAAVKATISGSGKSVAGFVAENSYGKASLAPTFYGVFDMPNIACSDITAQINAMSSAMSAQNTAGTPYAIRTYITNCGYGGGFASWGGGSPYKIIYMYKDYSFSANAHEVSHTLGSFLGHGGVYSCINSPFISPVSPLFENTDCVLGEYQDPYDTLGSSSGGHLSASHKLNAGWLDASQLTTATTPGTTRYKLSPYESASGLVALKVPRGNSGQYFTVEYRQPTGYDAVTGPTAGCQNCNATQGALLRLAGITFSGPGGGADSNIIDMTPGSNQSPGAYWPSADGYDGALLPNQTFSDGDYGISIKTISADPTGLTVDVTLAAATCNRAAPTLGAVTPSLQTATAGETKTFSLTVTSNDSPGCKADTYIYEAPTQDGYVSIQRQVTLSANESYFSLAPGQTKTLVLTARTTKSASDGDYLGIFDNLGWLTSKDPAIATQKITGGILRITSPADTTPPSQPTNPTAVAQGSSVVALSWGASIDNQHVAGYKVIVNNSAVYTTTDTSLTMTGLLPSTSYTFAISALDNKVTSSTPANVSVTTPAQTDDISPNQPGGVTVTASDTSYTISWQKPNDNVGVLFYGRDINDRNGSLAGKLSTTVSNLSSYYPFKTSWAAFDAAGNVSPPLPTDIPFRTAVPGDSMAPTRPDKLQAKSLIGNKATNLTWAPSQDNHGIAGYYIYRGAFKIAYTTTNSYADPAGVYASYRVQAVDVDGSVSPISKAIISGFSSGWSDNPNDTQPPTVTLTSPIAGQVVAGTISVRLSANDNVGVNGTAVVIDDDNRTPLPTSALFDFALDTTTLADGPHTLYVGAGDDAGNSATTTPMQIVVNNNNWDTVAPTVTIAAPAEGSMVRGTATLAATATDNTAVQRVEFKTDGLLVATDTTSPYEASWNTTALPNGTHTTEAIAYDAAGNSARATAAVTVQNTDSTPPTTPAGLTAAASAYNQVNLAWQASTDTVGVKGYYLVRNGTTIADSTQTNYVDSSLLPNTSYSFQVAAYDAAGNVSALSAAVRLTTPNTPDTIAPSAISGLTATAVSSTQINLSWNPSTDNIGVSGYEVYRNNVKLATVTTTSFGDSNLTPQTSYSYTVIAKDAAGNSSPTSSSVAASTPSSVVSATIQGVVTDSNQAPLSGATISLSVNGKTRTVTSGTTGSYTIANVPAGVYSRIKYAKRGYATAYASLTLQSGDVKTQNITLTASGKK